MTKQIKVRKRIDDLKIQVFLNWQHENEGIGVKRPKLMQMMGDEKRYIKRKVIAELRKEKKITLRQKYYFWRRSK